MKSSEADLQIAFFYRLKEIRAKYLQQALFKTIKELDITTIDSELKKYASRVVLNKIARFGIRGEVFLPVPSVLVKNPKLLGYYRLLYGISQKEFSKKYSRFKTYEENKRNIEMPDHDSIELTKVLMSIGESLITGIDDISKEVANELQLLTLGPQLRGGRNTELGKAATERTFALIKTLVKDYIVSSSGNSISIKNSLGRQIDIQFASDPDIVIIETLKSGENKIVSIEIKGGTDYSNAHNRLGEAEKSHQKAKQEGYNEFWTIVRVDIDPKLAKNESPTTTKFFNLDNIENEEHPDAKKFAEIVSSKLSIKI
jgi:hypothetical protein